MPTVAPIQITRVRGESRSTQPDLVAVEEPLEIRLGFGPTTERAQRTLAVTMRTPGHDHELALGYLLAEGIIQTQTDVLSCRHCVQDEQKDGNVIRVELAPTVALDWARLDRFSYASASCGLCGKTSIDALRQQGARPLEPGFSVAASLISALPDRIRTYQPAYQHTGGIHASALFTADGTIRRVREDIGRHNALDKVIGAAFWEENTPLSQYGLFLSGRIGFELVQKAWMAGLSLVVAVGAPSSLAVDLAREANITLVGFVRNEQFNMYTSPQRISEL
ncbi:MAG: formate dehydrogenase accessory sulfurtransferase FdhD [Cytophagales bacterium]|nr:MAG: formate dehydrogenase accessory sulfurtransferase FdhD [Cytophagales bacterium]